MNDNKTPVFLIAASEGKSLVNFRGSLIRHIISQGCEVVCTSIEPAEEISESIEDLGARYLQTCGSRVGIGINDGLKMIGEYRKVFKTVKPDCCLFYMSKPTAFGSVAAVLSGVKHFNILVNGLENAFYRRGAKDFLVRFVMTSAYRFACGHADNVFFQNHDDRDYFKKRRILRKDNSSVVGGSGVDMEHFSKQPLPEKPAFLMVSRLLFSKGIREYLSASSKVRSECPGARIMLLGGLDNNDEAISEEELRQYTDRFDIEYCGFADDVRPFLSQCSVFVLPSYHEGLPRSVIEAMSVGRAIITTDVPGCRETVEDGVNGFLVPCADSEALAQKMICLAKDGALRSSMAEQSIKICSQKFEVSKVNHSMFSKMKEYI